MDLLKCTPEATAVFQSIRFSAIDDEYFQHLLDCVSKVPSVTDSLELLRQGIRAIPYYGSFSDRQFKKLWNKRQKFICGMKLILVCSEYLSDICGFNNSFNFHRCFSDD